MTATETVPVNQSKILYAFGAGRTSSTKFERRMNRFGERVFNIGDHVTIRPGRRIEVELGYLAKHLPDVEHNVKRGALLVQENSEKYLSLPQLRRLMASAGLIEARPEDDEGPGEESAPEESSEPEETHGEQEQGESPPEDTQEPESQPEEQEEAPVAEPEPDLQSEPEEATPDVTPEEMASMAPAVTKPLPVGWRNKGKKELLLLASDRGLKADKSNVINVLASWEKAQG